jgi:hypothetical protein
MSYFTDICVCVYIEQDKRHSYSSSSSLRLFSALSLTVVRTTISVIAIVLVERREGGRDRKVRHKWIFLNCTLKAQENRGRDKETFIIAYCCNDEWVFICVSQTHLHSSSSFSSDRHRLNTRSKKNDILAASIDFVDTHELLNKSKNKIKNMKEKDERHCLLYIYVYKRSSIMFCFVMLLSTNRLT